MMGSSLCCNTLSFKLSLGLPSQNEAVCIRKEIEFLNIVFRDQNK